MTYAFTFDASACSGCKACQEACKDKNNLPVGVSWRRVVEVAGGGWTQMGESWTNNVFAYYLSIACNHCVHPKCAGVCPTDAFIHRADGIVYIDSSKCMGCGYCAWACPYNAPRYNFDLGQMAKCNFCFDNIDAGLPPSCVTACPMRVLNFVEVDTSLSLSASFGRQTTDDIQSSILNGQWSELWELPASEHPFPLPDNSRTEPHLAVKPHRAMNNSLEKKIANYEEIRPKKQKSETSLVVFTILAQMAVGAFWAGHWMVDSIPLPVYLAIGACLAVGGLFSFAHLGAKRNAWRAPFHLTKSWLSREILFIGLFCAGLLAALIPELPDMRMVTSLFGIGLIFSMAYVYRLHTMPAWDTWRTTAGFFITSILLGQLAMNNLLGGTRLDWGVVAVTLAIELALTLSAKPKAEGSVNDLRVGLIVITMLGAGVLLVTSNLPGVWISPVLFLLAIVEEIIGRVSFYKALDKKPL